MNSLKTGALRQFMMPGFVNKSWRHIVYFLHWNFFPPFVQCSCFIVPRVNVDVEITIRYLMTASSLSVNISHKMPRQLLYRNAIPVITVE